MTNNIKILSKENQLDVTIIKADNQKGGVVFVAGGGSLTKKFYREWQTYLAENGYSSIAFDFPSIGNSEGKLSESSLNTRLHDIECALDYFKAQTNLNEADITLCGRSMGGPLALRLAVQRDHKKVVLLYPAAYAADAYDKFFGDKFSEVIRKEGSWQDSPDFDFAENFEGRLLVIYGEFDSVIPKAIQERYLETAEHKGKAIILKDVDHNKFLWDKDKESTNRRHKLYQTTQSFLEQN